MAGPAKPDVVLKEARWAVDVWSRMRDRNSTDVIAAAHREAIGTTNGNQKKVHQLLAGKPLNQLADVYPSVFEDILNEEVANVTVDLKLATQGLEAAKREKLPLLFIFHKSDDNREAIGKWSLKLAQQSRNSGAPLPKIARSFVTIALPLDELPALSRLVGVEPYRAPNNTTPLFVIADSNGVQQNAVTGWHNDAALTHAMAWGLVHQAEQQELPMVQLRSLLKLVRSIDDRLAANVVQLIKQTAETHKATNIDTAVLLKHIDAAPQVATLPEIAWPTAASNWDSSGFFSVVDDGVALSLPTAGIGGEPQDPTQDVLIPNVTGLAHSVAAELLRSRGLTVDVPNLHARPGDVVVQQSIRPGKFVARGSNIRLDRVVTTLPDVVGMTLDDAQRLLAEAHGFAAVVQDELLRGDMKVTHQSPSGGMQVPRGEKVQLFNRRAMPTLVGMEISEACNLMDKAGIPFRLDSATVNGDMVYKQTPDPGDWLNGEASASVVAGIMVPDLTGSYDMAKHKLEKLGVVGEVVTAKRTFAYQPPFPVGQQSVYWQSIEPGKYISRSDILQVRTVTYRRRAVGF